MLTVHVMNIMVTITVGIKCAPEYKMKEKVQKFSERDTGPFAYHILTGEGNTPSQTHSSRREPLNHISGNGPGKNLRRAGYRKKFGSHMFKYAVLMIKPTHNH